MFTFLKKTIFWWPTILFILLINITNISFAQRLLLSQEYSKFCITEKDSNNAKNQKENIEKEKMHIAFPLMIGIIAGVITMNVWPEPEEEYEYSDAKGDIIHFFIGFGIGFFTTNIILEKSRKKNRKNHLIFSNKFLKNFNLNYIKIKYSKNTLSINYKYCF